MNGMQSTDVLPGCSLQGKNSAGTGLAKHASSMQFRICSESGAEGYADTTAPMTHLAGVPYGSQARYGEVAIG